LEVSATPWGWVFRVSIVFPRAKEEGNALDERRSVKIKAPLRANNKTRPSGRVAPIAEG
jgi:hypothetical protein